MSTPLRFLIGSNASHISLYSFTPSTSTISLVHKSDGLIETPSWVEPSANKALAGKVFYSVGEEGGQALSLGLREDGAVEITGSNGTFGGPAHIHAMKDGSGVVATNYMGGSAIFFPVDQTTGIISSSLPSAILSSIIPTSVSNLLSPSKLLTFESPYGSSPGPNADRQEAPHLHQCIEGEEGLLYIPDLGSDRVWLVKREGEEGLQKVGELVLPGGAGPRHVALSPNGKFLYALTELSHEIFIFPVPSPASLPLQAGITPLNHASPTLIIPTSVPVSVQPKMDAGELIVSPISPRTLYATNRGQVDLNSDAAIPESDKVKGDAIAIITLTKGLDAVESCRTLQTGANFLRGMGVTACGKYLGVVGQKGGEIEVYECGGERGEELKLVGRGEGVDLGTDFLWI